MIEILKKTLYTSIGLVYLTKEKVEELVKDLIEDGKMTAQEGKEFAEDLLKKSKEAKDKVEEQIDHTVKDTLMKMNLVSRKDYESLEERLRQVEDELKNK
ncbi:phasin family protein [bacterium]